MIDFPASPADGQIFGAPNGVVYRYSTTYASWLAQNPGPPLGGMGDFCAIHNTTWALTGSAAIMIPNTVYNGNAGSWYNATTGRYTPPAGRYRISVSTSTYNSGGTGGTSVLQLRKNGTIINSQGATTPSAAQEVIFIEVNADANGGDYFEVWGLTGASTGTLSNLTFQSFPLTGLQGPTGPPGGGKLLQTVSVETGAVATGGTIQIPLTDAIPMNTQGDQYLSLAITPQSATSKLIIEAVVNGSTSVAATVTVALFQDAAVNALAAVSQGQQTASVPATISLRHVMTSGTTSATTFRVRIGMHVPGTYTFNGIGGGRVFGGVMASSIVITEVLP